MLVNGCRLSIGSNGKVIGEDIVLTPTQIKELPVDIQNLITEDKKLGLLKPKRSDGWYTFKCYDVDKELNFEQLDHIIRMALFRWSKKMKVKFRPAKENEDPDLKLYFTDPQHDTQMYGSTLAYHYYPMGDSNTLKGICRINRNYYYTINGVRLNLHFIDPDHYPDAGKAQEAPTWDLDQILGHEFGHGIFGLMHDGKDGNMMSSSYTHMSEYPTDRDYTRAAAKVEYKPVRDQVKEARLEEWFIAKSEEFPIWVNQI